MWENPAADTHCIHYGNDTPDYTQIYQLELYVCVFFFRLLSDFQFSSHSSHWRMSKPWQNQCFIICKIFHPLQVSYPISSRCIEKWNCFNRSDSIRMNNVSNIAFTVVQCINSFLRIVVVTRKKNLFDTALMKRSTILCLHERFYFFFFSQNQSQKARIWTHS